MAERRLFPCCICGQGLEVRQTKKGKPYVICDPCGMQMFVRVDGGIHRFEDLVKDAGEKDIWARLDELQNQYKKKCPKCGNWFWVHEKLIATSVFDGGFVGYRCPANGCKGVVKSGEQA
jgi:hypothetical protein